MKYATLEPIKTTKTLSRKPIFTFDTETKDGLRGCELFCCSLAYHNAKAKSFKSIHAFYNFLSTIERNDKTIIYVHNLGFDARFLIDYCLSHDLKYNLLFSGSNCIMFEFATLKFRFIDSFQFLLESQEKAELTYNVDESLRKIHCNDLFERDYKTWTDDEKNRIVAHNINDVLALQQIMKCFRATLFEISNVDILSVLTLPSFALTAFRKTLKCGIVNPYIQMHFHDKKFSYIFQRDKYEFAKAAYFGGRVECFDHRVGYSVNYNDIVSMFPHHMMADDYPDGIPYWEKDQTKILKSLKTNLSIIEAIMIPNYSENYPILAFRKDDRVIFGNFHEKGTWTSVEIDYAMERGYKFEFLRALIFPFKSNYFAPFVEKFFAIKTKSTGGKRQGAKLILNQCYGKFGQRVDRDESRYEFFTDEDKALELYHEMIDQQRNAHMEFTGVYKQYMVRYTEPSTQIKPFQLVHLSAFVTAYSRLHIIKSIHKLTDKGVNVYYCDTDSIVCEPNALMPYSDALGGWQIERTFREFKAVSPKCYIARLDDGQLLLKCKGIRRDKITEILNQSGTIDEVYEKIKDDIVLDERYLPIKSSLVRNKTAMSSSGMVKHLGLEDKKRHTNVDLTTTALNDIGGENCVDS